MTMFDSASVDDLAAILWRTESEDAGAPASIAEGRTRSAFDWQSDELKKRWRKFARAALSAPLSTVTPAEVGGLGVVPVGFMRTKDIQHLAEMHSGATSIQIANLAVGGWTEPVYAATALEAKAAELAAKDEELSKQIEVRDDAIDNLQEKWWFQSDRAERAEAALAEARKALEMAQKKLRLCQWYWPEDDTSEDCCADSAQEVVQNAYDWETPSGEVVAVARGGIVDVTYCAALPPADDADTDDDFWVEEDTAEAAKALIDAEIARRALTGVK